MPDGLKFNETRFRTLLETEAGNHWAKSGTGGRSKPFLYRRIELVTHPGEEQGGEE